MTIKEAEALLTDAGYTDINVMRLINDKQNNCDKEIVLCVREHKPSAEIITSLFCDITFPAVDK